MREALARRRGSNLAADIGATRIVAWLLSKPGAEEIAAFSDAEWCIRLRRRRHPVIPILTIKP
jgi:hypothetical protein